MNEETDKTARQQQILQFMTTEHFTLQTARAATVAEANGRAALFISAVSSGVVALAFIGQVSQMGEVFFLFALVLFPSLIFLGFVSFDRVLQTALEDWIYATEINRIRHYYAEIAPEMKRYFIESTHDDAPGVLQAIGIKPKTWQYFLTGSGMVGVINSILVGVFTGIVLRFGVSLHIYAIVSIGAVVFAVSVWLHYKHQIRRFTEVGERMKMRFPSNAK
ncbi:MAG TPA: hypothetical protein VJ715_03580 [Pyrinomonadaceae bacterium]|nr:hypothetical protein [Pyrinomonadaceae bacterium]